MKKSLAAAVSAIVLSCVPLFVHAAPMASADPAVVAATKDMLAALKIRELMTNMMTQMRQQIPAQVRAAAEAGIKNSPKLSAKEKEEQLKQLDANLRQSDAQADALFGDPTLVDDMIAEMVPLYAETYTLDEIRQMTAFYLSPVGQKMQATMPSLMARSMEISQRVMMPRIQKAMAQSQAAAGK